jgi:Tfp pilus assembly protein PilN
VINLLPPQQKTDLLDQKRFRLILILGILFLSLLISIFLVLFLVKIFVMAELNEQKIILEEKEKLISLNQNMEKEITGYNTFLFDLNSFYQKSLDLTQLFEKIEETIPGGIYLNQFSLGSVKKEKESKVQITLSGYSPDRDILLEFRENLKNEEGISEVSFSPTSWVEPTDINFTVMFQLDK